MKMIVVTLAASVLLMGCASTPPPSTGQANYLASQRHQAPAIRNDAFGGGAMPMRGGLPR